MERIMKYLNRVYRASVLDRSAAFAEHGLSGYQISYILQVCYQPGLTQEELAARLFVNKSTVTRQLAQLIHNGYVSRKTDPDDRRYRRLFPTAKAEAIFPEIIAYLEGWNESLTAELSPEDQDKLIFLMRHLARAATDRLVSQDLPELLESEKEGDN